MSLSFARLKLSTLFATYLIAQAHFQLVQAGNGAPTYSATYLPYDAPKKSQPEQAGTNQVRAAAWVSSSLESLITFAVRNWE